MSGSKAGDTAYIFESNRTATAGKIIKCIDDMDLIKLLTEGEI